MPSFSARVSHGTIPGQISGLNLVENETDLTMQSVNRSGTATKTQFRDGDGNTYGVLYNDHILTTAITADLVGTSDALSAGSLPTLYSGQEVGTINNWDASSLSADLIWFGHERSEGELILEDPSLEASSDVTEVPSFSANLVHYPWMAAHSHA